MQMKKNLCDKKINKTILYFSKKTNKKKQILRHLLNRLNNISGEYQ